MKGVQDKKVTDILVIAVCLGFPSFFLAMLYSSYTLVTMNPDLPELHQRREQILVEMGSIDRLCRGHLSEQFFKSKRDGKTVRHGPYFVLQRWFRGKNLCERIAGDQVDPVRQGVEGYKRFRRLADEFADVCEQITLQTGNLPAVKKKRVKPSSRNSSRKPPVS